MCMPVVFMEVQRPIFLVNLDLDVLRIRGRVFTEQVEKRVAGSFVCIRRWSAVDPTIDASTVEAVCALCTTLGASIVKLVSANNAKVLTHLEIIGLVCDAEVDISATPRAR